MQGLEQFTCYCKIKLADYRAIRIKQHGVGLMLFKNNQLQPPGIRQCNAPRKCFARSPLNLKRFLSVCLILPHVLHTCTDPKHNIDVVHPGTLDLLHLHAAIRSRLKTAEQAANRDHTVLHNFCGRLEHLPSTGTLDLLHLHAAVWSLLQTGETGRQLCRNPCTSSALGIHRIHSSTP